MSALQHVCHERSRQNSRWGVQDHSDLYWLGIMMEEVGELAKAIIEGDHKHAAEELVQATAVGVAWLECIERRTNVATQPHHSELAARCDNPNCEEKISSYNEKQRCAHCEGQMCDFCWDGDGSLCDACRDLYHDEA